MELRTKEIIEQAVITLGNSMSFEKIRVRDICEKAGVSKQTFYNYFKDKFDVAAHIYEKDVAGHEDDDAYSYGQVLKNLEKIWSKRRFYKNVLKAGGQNSLSEYVRIQLIERVSREAAEQQGRPLTPEQQYLIIYHSYGWLGMIIEWLEGRISFTVEEFAALEKETFPSLITDTWKKDHF